MTDASRKHEAGADVDVLVVGGGMVGLTLACALKETPLTVAVVERSEPAVRTSLGRDCRVSAIVAGNVEILEGLGVWSRLEAGAGPIRAMRVWDGQHAGGIRFEAAEIGRAALGHLVENGALVAALRDELAGAEGVELYCPAEVESVAWRADCVEARLAGGRTLRAAVAVGADGGRSWLRGQAGVRTLNRPYRQQGIVATVRTAMPHHATAFQRFLPTGPLAFLPMDEPNLCSIVWSAEDAEAARLMALDDAGFAEALFHAFGPVLGRIEAVGARAAYPLQGRLAVRLVRPRTALIGDAAHVIHPLAGLGVNLGLRDAMVLAQELVDARRFGEDVGDASVLERYARLRLPDVLATGTAMEGFHQLFTRELPGLPALRGLGMRLVGNAGPLKRLVMRNSTGLSLPVPRRIS